MGRGGADRQAAGEGFFSLRFQCTDVLPTWLSVLPPWLLAGLALGALASLLAAGVFVVGDRLFPTATQQGGRVDGMARRRAEIRIYLGTIGERYSENHDLHGETVDFYLPERDVAITFDPQAYFRIVRAGTYAVLCEHEMPGRAVGRRLPFDVPEFDPDPVADPVADAFGVLGLPPSADADAVKAAYRERVKEAHPDHGGNRESFERLREAYATARDHAETAEVTA